MTRLRAPRFGVHAQIADLDIDAVAANGDGVGTLAGRRLSVPFTIPGERVRVRIAERRQRSPAATLVEILRQSPHRVVPACRHFGNAATPGPCGGCTWQHIAYPEQLRLKTALVDRLVRAVVPRAPATEPMLAATPLDAPWSYRNKVHFVFGASPASTLTMGHYARGSRRVIPVLECPVHDERGNAFAFAAREVFAASLQSSHDRGGPLRSLAIRVGFHTRELMATLIVASDRDKRLRTATRRLLEHTSPTSMHLNVHAREDAYIFGPSTRCLHGSARMRDEVLGVSMLMSPAAFFQTNVAAAEILVRLVCDAVPVPSRVLDLYAGSGLFAIPLALAGHEVVAVEESRVAVSDGEAALKLNGAARSRCTFVARRVETALKSFTTADVVVLDPPREGCSPLVVRDVFSRLRPRLALYVSCNPEALASDLGRICASGYTISALRPVDMFPHTAHIETVVTLTRGGST